ncbi:MAG: AAA family ATPase [Archangium sp.]|nr:AAA family ATPase [Archangium sp.]
MKYLEAVTAFRHFFLELREGFLERETLLTQLELALLCREHVLIIGPPGTAKSALASAVLGRIVDETSHKPSLFAKQLAENTVQTDLIGPVDFKVLTETGRTEYLTDEGMLGAVHAFLDEVFDGRDMLLRSILNVLHERELKHGRRVTPGQCECAVMTSNRYLSEVIQRSPETLQAFADRISFICFTPKAFARRASRAQMLWRAQAGQRLKLTQRLTLQQLDLLQDAVSSVEVPPTVSEGIEALADALEKELLAQVVKLPDYVPTKYFSQRTMVKALWALRAVVVRDRIYRRPDRPLVATIDDLAMLRHFFLLGGPPPNELEGLIPAAVDPRERAQLEIIRVEAKAFDEALSKVTATLAQAVDREASDLQMKDDLASAEGLTRNWSPPVAATVAKALRDKLVPGPRHPENRAPLLRAADNVLTGFELRVSKGMAGQGEGRGGAALLTSLVEVFEVVRRVPELQPRVASIVGQLVEFCRQATQMVALTAEATEFDEQVRLETIAGLAGSLAEELSKLSEVLQLASLVAPQVTAVARDDVSVARTRVATALRRRASRGFVATRGKGDALEGLVADSRRLRELEKALSTLSPGHDTLRIELLTPIAEGYVREVVGSPQITTMESLATALQSAMDHAAREGAAIDVVRTKVGDAIDARAKDVVRAAAAPPKSAAPESAQVLSGEAYTFYRQRLSAPAPEGELLALDRVRTVLNRAPGPSELRDSVVNSEIVWLGARVRYLAAWSSALTAALPAPDSLRSRADADKAFERLITSKLPMLLIREGELVRLQAITTRLKSEPGEKGDLVRRLELSIASLSEGFGDYARRLLDARNATRA